MGIFKEFVFWFSLTFSFQKSINKRSQYLLHTIRPCGDSDA